MFTCTLNGFSDELPLKSRFEQVRMVRVIAEGRGCRKTPFHSPNTKVDDYKRASCSKAFISSGSSVVTMRPSPGSHSASSVMP